MSAISPESINPLSLPSIPLESKRTLPRCPGIYFALSANGEVLYIGRSINICQRWASHHLHKELTQASGVRVAWLHLSDPSLLPAIETALIKHFKPVFNRKNPTSFAVPPGVEPKGRMMGFRPQRSLEQQIDEAVSASGLKLADWLEKAVVAYLQKSPQAEGSGLEEGQTPADRLS